MRLGVILGLQDLWRFFGAKPPAVEGSFVYVIEAQPRLVKVGITTDPAARLAALGTASPYALRYHYLAATPGPGTNIEQGAHDFLRHHRGNGEWFHCDTSTAVTAIGLSALHLGEPILRVSPEQAATIVAIARNAPAGSGPRPAGHLAKILLTILGLLLLFRLMG